MSTESIDPELTPHRVAEHPQPHIMRVLTDH